MKIIHNAAIYSTILIFSSAYAPCAWGQEKADTIYTDNKYIVAKVREVGPLDILYSLPNEAVTYRILKRNIQGIKFSSGRTETYNDQKNKQRLFNSNLWDNVNITFVVDEVIGLVKIDLITVKATGTTGYSNVTNTQNRAFRKLKQAAAMLGGDVVLVNNQTVEGNIPGLRSSRTQLTGTVYQAIPLDSGVFFKTIWSQTYVLKGMKSLGINNSSPRQTLTKQLRLTFNDLSDFKWINNVLYITADLGYGLNSYRVTYFDDFNLVIAHHHNSRFEELTLRKIKP